MRALSENWKQLKWGNLATLEYGKGLRGYQGTQGVYPVYGTNGQIGWHTEPLYHKPGIIIGRKGAYRGVHYSRKPFFVIDTAFYVNPKADVFDVKWAFYQLKNFDINNLDSGSAIPSTSREAFYQIPVLLPPLPTQHKISSILSAYDDLIENNTRRIQILEEMAQMIYQEWFVLFRFPGHEQVRMVDSEMGSIPEGWEVRKLNDIVADILDYRGKTPKKLGGDWSESGIMAISAMNIKQNSLINLEKSRFVSEDLYCTYGSPKFGGQSQIALSSGHE